MVPAKFARYSAFFVDHYVLCGVGRGNAERGMAVGLWAYGVVIWTAIFLTTRRLC